MSHELKTPLANIREGTELLMDGAVGELDSNQREVTGILRENGIKLQRLIENLLSFSAWQTNSIGLETSEFRLRPLVKQVLENQQLTLLSQRVRLDVKIEDVTLVADRGKLRLILENLLSNAIKYSPEGRHDSHRRATLGREPRARCRGQRPGHPAGGARAYFRCVLHGPHAAGAPASKARASACRWSRIRVGARRHGRDRRRRVRRRALPHHHAGATERRRQAREEPIAARSARMRRLSALAIAARARALLAGCASRSAQHASANAPSRPFRIAPQPRPACSSEYLELLQKLVQSAPAEQAEMLATAQREYELAPTPSHQLRYRAGAGRARAMPRTDLPRAQRLLAS